MSTAIQWTDETDNIIVAKDGGWWCKMCSPGCANCYAAQLNQNSFYGGNKRPYSGKPPELVLRTEILDSWARQRKPKRHFVASMTDVFGEWVPYGWAVAFLRAMWRAPQQTFQILTKRPEIAQKYIADWLKHDGLTQLPDNIWIGTSVENQEFADKRIPELLKIPAKVRFLSCEPLLGPVDLNAIAFPKMDGSTERESCLTEQIGDHFRKRFPEFKDFHQPIINWVIIGGESGPKARPCNIEWIRSLVQQCKAAGVAPFVKQLGANPFQHSEQSLSINKPGLKFTMQSMTMDTTFSLNDKKGGDISEWPEDLKVREFPV